MADTVTVLAPAKINLTLHVTGRTAQGYHLLDSLTGFGAVGDRIVVEPATSWSLAVTGPLAGGVPTDDANLALRAAHLIGGAPAVIHLDKHLPHAAGLGGGSADAAAVLRALAALDGRPLPPDLHRLGADVPACLAAHPLRLRGIGDRIEETPSFPAAHLCLVNPRVPVPTGAVFSALSQKDNAPMPEVLPRWPDTRAFAEWLAGCRNDLENPARSIAPAIGVALSRIASTEGCLLARMSGSGATCFGLYATAPEADAAADAIRTAHPDWWVVPTPLLRNAPDPS